MSRRRPSATGTGFLANDCKCHPAQTTGPEPPVLWAVTPRSSIYSLTHYNILGIRH